METIPYARGQRDRPIASLQVFAGHPRCAAELERVNSRHPSDMHSLQPVPAETSSHSARIEACMPAVSRRTSCL